MRSCISCACASILSSSGISRIFLSLVCFSVSECCTVRYATYRNEHKQFQHHWFELKALFLKRPHRVWWDTCSYPWRLRNSSVHEDGHGDLYYGGRKEKAQKWRSAHAWKWLFAGAPNPSTWRPVLWRSCCYVIINWVDFSLISFYIHWF